MSAMSLKKNAQYPDATPAVHLELEKARKLCAETVPDLAA